MFTSHSRVHGFPPREPWEFSEDFLKVFRKMVEMRYRLMPYIFTQAFIASQNGWPMLKAMFFNYADDPTTFNLEDQFMFGDDFLIAPLMEQNTLSRKVYLPKGKWIDYLTNEVYEGAQWLAIKATELPGIVLVKHGAVIPHIALAQSTELMDWENIELVVFDEGNKNQTTFFYFPNEKAIEVQLNFERKKWKVNSPVKSKIKFSVRRFDE
jgi:alpha-D-xyloside xylohydrolase